MCMCKKRDSYKPLKLLKKGVEDSPEYTSLGNKLGNYFINKKNMEFGQSWCYFFCRDKKFYNDTEIKEYIKDINNALPLIKREFSKIKPNKSVKNDAVIHIRCSDVPFRRSNAYHLQPEAYYKWIAEKCKRENVKAVHFLMCSNHHQDKKHLKNKCTKIVQTIRTCMKEFLPNVEMKQVTCLNILKSFQMFLGCKILAQGGAGPSSFSFFPGLTKGENFLTPKFISENSKQKSKLLDKWIHKFPWSMWDGDPIWHSNVDDYIDLDMRNIEKFINYKKLKVPYIWICWPGNDKKPLYLQLCIDSIKRHNASKFEIIVVDLVKATQLLGQLPEYFLYLRYAHRSDYLRVHLLAKYGGIYVDADTIGIKPLWPLWKKAKSQGFEMITTAGQTDLLGNSGNMVRFEALGVIQPNCSYIQLLRDRQHKLFTSKLPQLLKNKKAPKTDPLSWSEGLYELMKTYNSLPLAVRNSKIYYDPMWSWNPTPKQIQSNICPSKIKTVCLVVLNNSYYNKEIKSNNFCNMNSCLSKLLCKKVN